MGSMVCSICGYHGIYWKNLGGLQSYTYCPTCGNTNCQMPEPRDEDPVSECCGAGITWKEDEDGKIIHLFVTNVVNHVI
jgi:hypothetical protein